MGVETDNFGMLPFRDDVLIGIIEIETKSIHGVYNLRHLGRREADQRDTAINQDILDENGKYGTMSQTMQNHSQGVEGKIAHQHLIGWQLFKQLPNRGRLSLT